MESEPPSGRRVSVLLGACLLLLWALASGVRLRLVEYCAVSSDSLGPYLSALSASMGHLPRPPNPESGDALWWMVWPLLWVSDSLRSLFSARLVLGALVAPMGAWSTWCLSRSMGRSVSTSMAATVAVGLLLALDPGLLESGISGARGYLAPELVGVATLGLVVATRGRRSGLVIAVAATVWAVDHHPLAVGVLGGWLCIAPTLVRVWSPRFLSTLLILAGFLALPRLVRIWAIGDCGLGFWRCLDAVSASNVDPDSSMGGMLWRALRDRARVDLGWVWLVLAFGLVASLWIPGGERSGSRRGTVVHPGRMLGIWALGSLFGILIVGMEIDYIRNYHLRILALPIAVAAVTGLGRSRLLSGGIAVWVAISWGAWTPLAPPEYLVRSTDRISESIDEVAPPIWVDRVWWNGEPCAEPSGVVLSSILSGRDPHDFQVDSSARFVLIECGWPENPAVVPPDHRGPREFSSAAFAHDWFLEQEAEPVQRGGAWDWASVIHPDTIRLEHTEWSP